MSTGRFSIYQPAGVVALSLLSFGVPAAVAQVPAGTAQEKSDRGPGKAITDSWITMKVHAQFVPEDALEDSNIDVDTRNGIVTLSGTVVSDAGRARAVAIAKATDGVKNVVDNLRIGPEKKSSIDTGARETADAAREGSREAAGAAKSAGRKVTDGWIKSKIYAQYLTEDSLDDSDIDIDVASGAVTLNGTVKSDAGRARAVALAKATDGVSNVKDNLTIGAHR